MPGPGPHMMYALGSGIGLMGVSKGRFSPHHCVAYALNAFFGPDIGSFSEWLTTSLGFGDSIGSSLADLIHDPFYYIFILGIPLSLLYSWASRLAFQNGILDSISGVSLSAKRFFLICLVMILKWLGKGVENVVIDALSCIPEQAEIVAVAIHCCGMYKSGNGF
ncbi:hypothetical protein Ancab_035855 [Ancistrocladus abbreviatus]